ncbi:MAG: Ig-like domain-containing protein, partial [bacterium]
MPHLFKSFLLLTSCFCLLTSASHAQKAELLRVTSTFPKGQAEATNQTQTIVASFNKPMTALKQLPEGEGAGPLKITPAVKGKYRWIGTSTISFTPLQPLEIATEYKVTIPAGVKATDGSAIEKEVSWSFTTPRPVLLASFPGHNQKSVDIATPIYLRFTQSIDLKRASSFIQIREGSRSGSTVPFTIGDASLSEL